MQFLHKLTAAALAALILTGCTGNAEPTIVTGQDVWPTLLVNEANPLPKGFSVRLMQINDREQVDIRMADHLNRMLTDAGQAGFLLFVVSGYRTEAEQQRLFEQEILACEGSTGEHQEAEKQAQRQVARPGYSEHQTGLAVDIDGTDTAQTPTPGQLWLAENSWAYGFILRYPSDKTDKTGRDYEPWHFRYVGETAAKQMYTQNWCLEEYVEKRGQP